MNIQKISRIKTLLKLSALFLAAFMIQMGDASAQGPGGHQRGTRGGGPSIPDSIDVVQRVKKMSKHLELSPTQQSKLVNLSQEHFEVARAQQKAEKIERIKKREAKQAAQEEYQSQIKGLLNAEQQEKYDEMMAYRKERRMGKLKGKGEGKHKKKRKKRGQDGEG